MNRDYAALGFRAGLEIHQQLDTPKLFCRCPSRLDESEAVHVTFTRALKPTASELGEVDRAALEEARKSLLFRYEGARGTCCLVEMDEEPPHAMTPEALDAALQVTLLLRAKPVDEVHVMRKIVVDGSNTSGFQRTSLLATQGLVTVEGGDVRVGTLCLEEDSARRLEREGNVQRYRLDRLGIPLVEIATETDIRSPQHARETAEAIGMALRATGKVKRGIGTIRQDLNVSIREGARVEIKGVQELRLIAPAVEWEVERQVHLLEVRQKLRERGATPAHYLRPVVDASDLFASTQAKMVKGNPVFAVALPLLAGLLGKKGKEQKDEAPPPRVGRELADYAKVKAGVKGIFHSDELPAYGITAEECARVVERLNLGADDAFALVVERREVAEVALQAVLQRAATLLDGVPEETRDLNPDATSRYLRPLPGGARMYPETDVPPVTLDKPTLARIQSTLPEMPREKLARFLREYPDLGQEQAGQVVRQWKGDVFEAWVRETGLVREGARMLLHVIPELPAPLQEKGDVEARALDVLRAVKAGEFAKEAMGQVLQHVLETGARVQDAVAALGLGKVDRAALVADIDAAIAANASLVERQRERASGPLMGPLMAKHKGKASGQEISALLQERIAAFLAGR